MSIDPSKATERSVDSLQKIYAVVIALAMSQSIQGLLKDPTGAPTFDPSRLYPALPSLVGFLVTLVPFWHGMNRHLDRCYLEKTSAIVQGALLLDFVAFFIEATFLFAAGWSLGSGIRTFKCLGLLLCIDMLWGVISHQIHFPGKKSHSVRWSGINLAAFLAAILVVEYPFDQKPIILMVLAVIRSVADYAVCWNFYFPSVEQKTREAVGTI